MRSVIILLLLTLAACAPTKQPLTLLVGTYTSATSQGIYRTTFDPATGSLSPAELVVEVDNPSYLALAEDGRLLYAVSEGGRAKDSALNAYRYDAATDTYKLLSRRPTGASPCYVALHDGYAYTANYTGGSLTRFPIAEDGSIDEGVELCYEPKQGRASHIHGVFPSPDGGSIYVTDLGRSEIFQLVDGVEQSRTALPMGRGPRHMAFSKDGAVAYALNELSGTVAVFDIEPQGLSLKQEIASDSVGGGGSADIHLSPDGRFLYASNRLKEDGISTFEVAEGGELRKIDYTHTGCHPRNFTLTPAGDYLLVAVRDDDRIEVFRRDAATGVLTATGVTLDISRPVCLVWR